MSRQEFAALIEQFTPAMKAAAGATQLRAIWASFVMQGGAFKRVQSTRVESSSTFSIPLPKWVGSDHRIIRSILAAWTATN